MLLEFKQYEGADITGYRFAVLLQDIDLLFYHLHNFKKWSFLLKKNYISKVCVGCSYALLHLTTVLLISTDQNQSCLFGTREKNLTVSTGGWIEIRKGFRLKN